VTSTHYRIPFNRPFLTGDELPNIARSLEEGRLAGDGPFTKRCQELLERRFGAHRALLTTSGTAALEMAALLCELEPGDEVILPSYTFVSTANAFLLRGARPVFVDVRPDTLNLDERLIADAITSRTRAIVPVHYAGVGCEMDTILSIAAEHGLNVIEDAAQGVNAAYRGRYLGTLGDLGAYSFHETKNFVCGEGGAILVNRPGVVERAEIVREKGTNRALFYRGQVDKYTWMDVGSSYVPADLLAAFLYAQLQHLAPVTAARQRLVETYRAGLRDLAESGQIRLPTVPAECSPNYHMFYLVVGDLATRSALIDHLKSAGIGSAFHYVPLHTAPMGLKLGYRQGQLPVTESVSDRLLRLPLYPSLTDSDAQEVIEAVRSYFQGRA
jgi:dTDP-4-amino-4,6-dideoxygalactose transaminase